MQRLKSEVDFSLVLDNLIKSTTEQLIDEIKKPIKNSVKKTWGKNIVVTDRDPNVTKRIITI